MNERQNRIHSLFDDGVMQEFTKDDVIINAFEEPDGMYLIEKGYVKSYSITDEGETNTQLIRSAGDIFPLLWATGRVKRDVYFAAMGDVTVRRISSDEFASKIDSNGELLKEMNSRLAEVYLLLAERVRNLEQRRAKDRLVYCLRNLGERFGRDVNGGAVIEAPVSHHDIADLINTSRETTSREFALLEKDGFVGYQDKQIVLHPKFDLMD